jgi:predicted small integral membrane protein
MGLGWMAWTFETAAFFAVIACLLLAMTAWEILVPGGGRRRGVLAIETTRGDRLFIALLGGAYIHLAWLGLLGSPLWGAMVVTLIFAGAVFRWV